MTKLKPTSIGLTFGVMLAILYTIRTVVLLLFPDFVVNLANKIVYNMISIRIPIISMDAFVIGVIALFIGGFVLGAFFALINNWVAR